MTIFNIIFFAFAFRILGGGFINIKRRYAVPIVLLCILAAVTYDIVQFIAYAWLFAVARILPTNTLLSAINGEAPKREDGRWQKIQDYAKKIWFKLPIKWQSWQMFAMIYGFVRTSLALPAMFYIGGFSYLFLLQSVIYWVGGKIRNKDAMLPEMACGALYGACL